MATVDFHPLAIAEARAAWRRYARVSAALAARFMAALDAAVADAAVAEVAAAPAAHAPYHHQTRVCRLKRFPYLLVFLEVTPNLVLSVAVAHTSRRPGYWRRRLP